MLQLNKKCTLSTAAAGSPFAGLLQAEARAHAHKVLVESKLDLPQTDQLVSNGKPAAKPQPTRTQTVDLDSRPGSAGQKQVTLVCQQEAEHCTLSTGGQLGMLPPRTVLN